MPDLDDLQRARERASEHLHSLPNVDSVGVGFKEVGGEVTGRLCLRVYVAAKRPESELAPHERVPDRIAGVETDVIEKPADELVASDFKARPTACGVQIERAGFLGFSGTFGTATCYVHRKQDQPGVVYADDPPYLLSAGHVFDPTLMPGGGKPIDDRVHQPEAVGFVNSIATTDEVVLGGTVDAGIALMTDGVECRNYVWKLGALKGLATVDHLRTRVGKHGRTTGRTFGEVVDFSYTFRSAYADRKIVLTDQMMVRPVDGAEFCAAGDSGAPVVLPGNEECHLVGLLVGRTGDGSGIASKIQNVFAALDLDRLGD